MPIETSPIPFGHLQLPYTPLFDPTAHPDIAPPGTIYSGSGGGGMMDMGMNMGPPVGVGRGMGTGSGPGLIHPLISHGPASVAASAIIAPTPGAVAGPHRAIPALPDAGYTAPTMRAASITGYPHNLNPIAGIQRVLGPGGEGSVYAGGSMYGAQQQSVYTPSPTGQTQYPQQQMAYQGSTHSDGFSASLPAPRRAPIITPLPQSRRNPQTHTSHNHAHSDAERGRHHDRSPSEASSPHRHHYHHQSADDDDGASDASYYAQPRHGARRQRTSSQGSSASESSSPETVNRCTSDQKENKGNLHRRTLSSNHQAPAGRHRSPSMCSLDHEHSPSPSSPLRAADGARGRTSPPDRRSTLGPEDDSDVAGAGLAEMHLNEPRRSRRSSHSYASQDENGRTGSIEGDKDKGTAGRRPSMPRQKSNLRPIEGSLSDSEHIEARRSSIRERSTSRLRRRSKDDADVHGDVADGEGNRRRSPKSPGSGQEANQEEAIVNGRVRRVASSRRSRKHADHRGQASTHDDEGQKGQESPYHRPHLPVDYSPTLSPHSGRDYLDPDQDSRSRRHSHDHRHHFSEEHHPHHECEHEDTPQHRHRRTNSEASQQHPRMHQQHAQREYAAPPQAGTLYPGQSASLVGGGCENGQYPHQSQHAVPAGYGHAYSTGQAFVPHGDGGQAVQPFPQQQSPQMGMGPPGQIFEDGASAAGTGLTFMDGAMGGRVSQYGLPKYAHNPKVDYRRFCVQRGNADVFIE